MVEEIEWPSIAFSVGRVVLYSYLDTIGVETTHWRSKNSKQTYRPYFLPFAVLVLQVCLVT